MSMKGTSIRCPICSKELDRIEYVSSEDGEKIRGFCRSCDYLVWLYSGETMRNMVRRTRKQRGLPPPSFDSPNNPNTFFNPSKRHQYRRF